MGESQPPAVGEVLAGKYRVEKLLGRGGMGLVVKATHIQLDEPVAIKMLLPEAAAADPDVVLRFEREAKAARKIKSEHVVRIMDIGTLENGAPFMVMEYLDGTDLDRLVRTNGPQSVSNAVDYVLQACEALAEAHVQGMVHRDLKPANLFLAQRADGTPLVKVLDFGISKVTGANGIDLGITKTSSTVLGSPLYMAPEQMRSLRAADARTDIWALGVILHELLAGTPPFNAQTLTELCVRILQDAPPSLRSFRTDVPAALESIVLRCLEKEGSNRHPNVAALALDLEAYGSSSGKASAERVVGVFRKVGIAVSGNTAPPPAPTPALGTSGFGQTAVLERPASTAITGPPSNPGPQGISTGPQRTGPQGLTQPQAFVPALGTTTTGKAWGQDHGSTTSPPPPLPKNTNGPVVAAIAATIAIVGLLSVLVVPRLRSHAATAKAPDAVTAISAPAATPASEPPPTASAIAAEPLPSASEGPKPVAVPAPVPRPVVVPAPAAAPKPDCTTPYYFDSEHKKKWKRECVN